MIYHVLPGDSLAPEFVKTGIEGHAIICRECLAVGDVDAENLAEFWDQRARFIASEYGEDEVEYHETVAHELARLLDAEMGDEVNLWFEYELFCSVNLWFCLFLLSETEARVFRVSPSQLKDADRWEGFGDFEATDLRKSFEQRLELTREDVELGRDLWIAFRSHNHDKLDELAKKNSETFPHLAEVCAAAPELDTRPAEIVAEIMLEGNSTIEHVFPEFKQRAGVYGYGDLQVEKLIARNR